jgi:flavorubredoxin
MTIVTEIAPDLYRISTYIPEINLRFNQFLLKDDEPLLYHTGLRRMFPKVRDAVATIINPSQIRWVAFSHFEADECGSLNEWLDIAPEAEPVCSLLGASVSINDFANRPAHAMRHNEVLSTGKYRLRFQWTPHVPHGWDAGHLYEETHRTLLCSDLFHQVGDAEPVIEKGIIERARQTIIEYQAGPLAYYFPYTLQTDGILRSLAQLNPKCLATMHGSTFVGDGKRALQDLAEMWKETLHQPQFLQLPV